MAWDFSTEPEFEAQLDWMREVVRADVWPLETVADEHPDRGPHQHREHVHERADTGEHGASFPRSRES